MRFIGANRRRLVIILSQDTRAVFDKLDFDSPVVCIWERGAQSYFLREAEVAVSQLADAVAFMGFVEVVIFGTSKGGFGALLWGNLLAERNPRLLVTVVAFSPQTRLFPENSNIKFPSYTALIKAADTDNDLARDLRKHGEIVMRARANLYARVYYPERVSTDAAEATRLQGPCVALRGLPLSTHNTVFPFLADMSQIEVVRKGADALLRAAATNDDLASVVLDERREELIWEYHAMGAQPLLAEVIVEATGAHPGRARILPATVGRRLWGRRATRFFRAWLGGVIAWKQ